MTQAANNGQLAYALVGLDAIGRAFGRSRQTARRWINQYDFPACRLPSGAWCTTPALIDRWVIDRKGIANADGEAMLQEFVWASEEGAKDEKAEEDTWHNG